LTDDVTLRARELVMNIVTFRSGRHQHFAPELARFLGKIAECSIEAAIVDYGLLVPEPVEE
jgi:hypothetical protein